jgi:hypothetical protein
MTGYVEADTRREDFRAHCAFQTSPCKIESTRLVSLNIPEF